MLSIRTRIDCGTHKLNNHSLHIIHTNKDWLASSFLVDLGIFILSMRTRIEEWFRIAKKHYIISSTRTRIDCHFLSNLLQQYYTIHTNKDWLNLQWTPRWASSYYPYEQGLTCSIAYKTYNAIIISIKIRIETTLAGLPLLMSTII